MATPLEKLRQLDEQRDKIIAEAKKEALGKANAAIRTLNELGFNYQLVEKGSAAGSRKGTRTIKDAPCDYCGFKTNPPHDKRAHRMQPTDDKRPFSDAELAEKGYVKV